MDRTSQRERAWNNKNKMANIQISSSHKKGKATVYFSQEVGGRNRPKILRWLLQKTKTVHFLQYSHNLPGNTIWNIFTVLGNTVPSMPHDPNLVSTLDHIHFNHSDPSCHSYKLPGILSDEHLWASFSLHIDSLKSKLSKSLYGFNRVKKLVPQKTPKTLYICLLISLSHALLPTHSQLRLKIMVNKIVIMQKQALPTFTLYHSSPPFKILPYHKIIYCTRLN